MDISEFLFKTFRAGLSLSGRVHDRWDSLKNYYGQVPKEIERRFIEESWNKDYILESLQTHDWKGLSDKLVSIFGSGVVGSDSFAEEGDNRRAFYVRLKGTKEHPFLTLEDWGKNLLKTKEVQRWLDFYNYTFREVGIGKDSTLYFWFEPRYTESADDFIYETCHGIVYHITHRKYLDNILQKGLRCKPGGPEGKEKYPDRIYFWAHEPQKTYKTLQDIRDFVKNDLYRDEENPPDWKEDLAVIRVRLWAGSFGHNKFPVYKDTAMNRNAFFTYTNVPAGNIEKVVKYPGQE